MTDFKSYYHTKFRNDINRFFSTIPDASKFHEDTQNKQTFSIFVCLSHANEKLFKRSYLENSFSVKPK